MWVCGLKQRCAIKATQGTHVTPYVGVWIETLKQFVKDRNAISHTLCGCVD